jgi:hypothetical protein
MNEADIGWLAGILDGEGYIGIQSRKDGRASVFLVVNTTSALIADKMKSVLIGLGAEASPTPVRTVKSRPTRRPFVQVRLTSMDKITRVLTACRPHLTSKAAEADVMLYYISTRQEHSATWHRSDVLRALCSDTDEKLKALKRQARMPA